MKKNFIVYLLLIICIFLFITSPAPAEDMLLQGTLASREYISIETLTAAGNCTVPAGATVTLSAVYQVILKPNFKVEPGGSLHVTIPDNDGLSNRCEMTYFGHLNYGPQEDTDFDWLNNLTECDLETNPNEYNPDNDKDKMPDWWEVKYFGITLVNEPQEDADGDGVTNLVEFKLNANPTVKDLPGPGLYYEYDALGRIKSIYRIPKEFPRE